MIVVPVPLRGGGGGVLVLNLYNRQLLVVAE